MSATAAFKEFINVSKRIVFTYLCQECLSLHKCLVIKHDMHYPVTHVQITKCMHNFPPHTGYVATVPEINAY